jgi:hypothetical protein
MTRYSLFTSASVGLLRAAAAPRRAGRAAVPPVDRARERGVYALLHRALAVRADRARHGR